MKKLMVIVLVALASCAQPFVLDAEEYEQSLLNETLRSAVINNKLGLVIGFINMGADVNAHVEGFAPIHVAAMQGRDNKIIKELLSSGADVNSVIDSDNSFNGLTPLHLAAMVNRQTAITFALLEAGANVNALSPDGATPLAFAELAGNPVVAGALRLFGGTK